MLEKLSSECKIFILPKRITDHCIGYVCIGDKLKDIKKKYKGCKIKKIEYKDYPEIGNYHIFDSKGDSLITFSIKNKNNNINFPVRLIQTFNSKYKYKTFNIKVGSKVSELIKYYKLPKYYYCEDLPCVTFKTWPIKKTSY